MWPLFIQSAFKCESECWGWIFILSLLQRCIIYFFLLYILSPAGIYCCGLLSTRKSDCTGLPQSMLINTEAPQQRGQSHIKMRGNTSIINWYNKGSFRFLTNAYSPTKEGKKNTHRTGRLYVSSCLNDAAPQFIIKGNMQSKNDTHKLKPPGECFHYSNVSLDWFYADGVD